MPKITHVTSAQMQLGSGQLRPGFLFPLVFDGARFAVASKVQGRVSGFTGIHCEEKHTVPVETSVVYEVGSDYVYGFWFAPGDFILGSHREVSDALLARTSALLGHPFTMTEVAGFIGNEGLWKQATERCCTVLNSTRAGAGDRYLQTAQFSPFNPNA